MVAAEALGPAETIISTVLTYSDHMAHNRPGVIVPDPGSVVGVRWMPATYKVDKATGAKQVFRLDKVGKKTNRTLLGLLADNGAVMNGPRQVGEYRNPGLFPEVAVWLYKQIADVWKLDNEFAARWASYAYRQEHRDLKVALAAFMLVQTRKGDPVKDNGKVIFMDEDYRDIGEAMALLYEKGQKHALDPKLLVRIHALLSLPGIAEVNQKLGFGHTTRRPFLGRWEKAVNRYLRYREENPKLLEGLVKAGFRTTILQLAQLSHFKPESPRFFKILRWRQAQAKDGRRTLAIGEATTQAETWAGLDERQVCERIQQTRPSWKRLTSLLPPEVGLTRAVMASAIESGIFSDKDLIIATPTLEELGLLEVQDIKQRWEQAIRRAEDMRAANIATRVKTKAVKEKLQDAADNALKNAVEAVVRDMRVYFFVDVSSSMTTAIQDAKGYIARFLQAFPLDRVHVARFNTNGVEVKIPQASAAGVEQAFRGFGASGGTDYGSGVAILAQYKPKANEDSLFIFVGDEEAAPFARAVRDSGLRPTAFGLVRTPNAHGMCVRQTAAELGIPCFMIDTKTFEDPYAIPRTIRGLVAATPVNKAVAAPVVPRVTLVDTILKTELLKKPAWAA